MDYSPASVGFRESIIVVHRTPAFCSLILPTALRSDYITTELSSASKLYYFRYLSVSTIAPLQTVDCINQKKKEYSPLQAANLKNKMRDGLLVFTLTPT